MNITDATALLGCITGFISLAISLRSVWLERFSLKISFYEYENMFFNKLPDSNCKTNLQGIIRVRFVNKSSTPITIYSIKLEVAQQSVTHRTFDGSFITLTTYCYEDGASEYIEVPMNKQITLPIRLESYDSVEGYIFIPFFPDTNDVSQSLKLRAETTKGVREARSRIWDNRPLIEDGDGSFYQ